MAIPIIFIGIAAVTGSVGIGKTVKAGMDQSKAKNMNDASEEELRATAERLNYLRKNCGSSLEELGKEKMFVLNGNITKFLEMFQQIKNVDFQESSGLEELSKIKIDQKDFEELKKMTGIALSISKGVATGAAGGTIAAFGAYGLASTFATASTGTAISTLSGAAASNATLAFFGGGSLAAGGLGVAGGTAVLGGIIGGVALMTMGFIIGAKAGKNLEDAYSNKAKVAEMCEEYNAGADQCIAIRRRTYLFYSLLARLDSYMTPLLYEMDEIIKTEGLDYSAYSPESKKIIAQTASLAVSIKSVLDTAILSEDGSLMENTIELVKVIDGDADSIEKLKL